MPENPNPANKDGKLAAAYAVLKAHPKASVRETVALVAAAGIKRGKTWVSDARFKIAQENGGKLP